MKYPWLKQMWKDAQKEKCRFIKAASDIEIAYLRKHKLKRQDVSFIWLDELLIGIEVRDGKEKTVFYDDELR